MNLLGAKNSIWFSKLSIHSDLPLVEAGLGAVSNPKEGAFSNENWHSQPSSQRSKKGFSPLVSQYKHNCHSKVFLSALEATHKSKGNPAD